MKTQNNEKPVNDHKWHTLKNGLKVLLISEKQKPRPILEEKAGEDEMEVDIQDAFMAIEKESNNKKMQTDQCLAAASMCVGTGSFEDPCDIQGLMHLLEHMIVVGSKKYPTLYAFDEFIESHGGSYNGHTDYENTSFYFDVKEEQFEVALDMFAQFFVAPLLSVEALENEIEAVEMEIQDAARDERWRAKRLLSQLVSEPSHPMSRCGWGNKDTFRAMRLSELHSQLLELRSKHYSAQNMFLAVQATLSLTKLTEMVERMFSEIPTNYFTRRTYEEFGLPFSKVTFHKLIKVIPLHDSDTVEIRWAMPSVLKHYECKPLAYIAYLIGHEGSGSVISLLRKRGWAYEIDAGKDSSGFDSNSTLSLFTIRMHLTNEGYSNLKDVIDVVFAYIQKMVHEGPNERTFTEIQNMQELYFQNLDQISSRENVLELSENMHQYQPPDVFTGSNAFISFNPDIIKKHMLSLLPNSCNIMLSSMKFKAEKLTFATEEWCGTKYFIQDINELWINEWEKKKSMPELFLPSTNTFVLDKSERLASRDQSEMVSKCAQKVECSSKGELWHKELHDSGLGKADCYVYYSLKYIMESPEMGIMLDIFLNLFTYYMLEELYPACVAQYDFSIRGTSEGFCIHVGGYSQKLMKCIELMKFRLENVQRFIEEKVFDQTRELLARVYEKNEMSAIASRNIESDPLQETHWSASEKLGTLHNVTKTDFISKFVRRMHTEKYVRMLVQGSVDLEKIKQTFLLLTSSEMTPNADLRLEQGILQQNVGIITPAKSTPFKRKLEETKAEEKILKRLAREPTKEIASKKVKPSISPVPETSALKKEVKTLTSESSEEKASEVVKPSLSEVPETWQEGETILMVGDSRVDNLKETNIKATVKAYSMSIAEINDIAHLVDVFLDESVSTLIIIGFHSDFTKLAPVDLSSHSPGKVMICRKPKFKLIVKAIVAMERKLKNKYPNLKVLWTLPTAPDFLKYNFHHENYNKYIYKETMTQNFTKYVHCTLTIKKMWPTISFYPLVDLFSFPDKGLEQTDKHRRKFSVATTYDGFHYKSSQVPLFWDGMQKFRWEYYGKNTSFKHSQLSTKLQIPIAKLPHQTGELPGNAEPVLKLSRGHTPTKETTSYKPDNTEPALKLNQGHTPTKEITSYKPDNAEAVLKLKQKHSPTKEITSSEPDNAESALKLNQKHTPTKEITSSMSDNAEPVLKLNQKHKPTKEITPSKPGNAEPVLKLNQGHRPTKEIISYKPDKAEPVLKLNQKHAPTKEITSSKPDNAEPVLKLNQAHTPTKITSYNPDNAEPVLKLNQGHTPTKEITFYKPDNAEPVLKLNQKHCPTITSSMPGNAEPALKLNQKHRPTKEIISSKPDNAEPVLKLNQKHTPTKEITSSKPLAKTRDSATENLDSSVSVNKEDHKNTSTPILQMSKPENNVQAAIKIETTNSNTDKKSKKEPSVVHSSSLLPILQYMNIQRQVKISSCPTSVDKQSYHQSKIRPLESPQPLGNKLLDPEWREAWRKKKILLVGDDRVEKFMNEEIGTDLPSNVHVSWKSEATTRTTICLASLLLEDYKDAQVLILMCCHYDLVEITPWYEDQSFDIMVTSVPKLDVLAKKMALITQEWREQYPDLVIIWTLPYVPDFKVFNIKKIQGTKVSVDSFEDQMRLEEQQFRCMLKELEYFWKELTNITLFDLGSIFPRKKSSGQRIRRLASGPFAGSTVDGFYPDSKTARYFWQDILKIARKLSLGTLCPKVQFDLDKKIALPEGWNPETDLVVKI